MTQHLDTFSASRPVDDIGQHILMMDVVILQCKMGCGNVKKRHCRLKLDVV